jgi:hypothetical protein
MAVDLDINSVLGALQSQRELASRTTAVAALAEELFGGDCAIAVEADPELETLKSTVVRATTRLSPQDCVERRLEWHRRVASLVGTPHDFSLVLDII